MCSSGARCLQHGVGGESARVPELRGKSAVEVTVALHGGVDILELALLKREAAVEQQAQISLASGGQDLGALWFAGVRPALRRLARRGVPVVACSINLREVVLALIGAGGMANVLKTGETTTQEDVKRMKPAPDAFLRAAEMLGLRPWRCVAVEDSMVGVQAAVAARIGWVIGVVNTGGAGTRESLLAAGATLVFEQTTDAIEWCRAFYLPPTPSL